MELTIGADPELFLEDMEGKVISAIGKIGGTKKRPKKVLALGRGFAIQEDNVLLEYNIPPASGVSSWANRHSNMMDYLRNLVGEMGLRLSNKASHSMDVDQLQDKKSWVFGCEPDFDVWELSMNPSPRAEDPNLRSAGGHIHIGYANPNPADSIKIARLCDLFIGAPLKKVDPDTKRAELYGRPGAIRFKPYGFEYRTPSNYWVLSQDNRYAVYKNVVLAVELAKRFDDYLGHAKEAKRFLSGELKVWENEMLNDLIVPYV